MTNKIRFKDFVTLFQITYSNSGKHKRDTIANKRI